jgi:hypothetical protein
VFLANYKGLGTPTVISAMGNNFFTFPLSILFPHQFIYPGCWEILKVEAKNAAQGVRHKHLCAITPLNTLVISIIPAVTV